jgi:sulfite reductase (NADPH) flavoprotein alpha-component
MTELIEENHILDVVRLADFNTKRWFKSSIPSAQKFASTLRKIQPRLYSISSCQKLVGNEVHFTIETVRYDRNERAVEGVASTWFADRLNIDEHNLVPVYLHPNPRFKLPTTNSPVIFIGPGTGIAPFRAFLQEKEMGDFTGDVWLLFGHQHEKYDFLYQEEFEDYQQSGLVKHLDLAWSRDQESKVYVQHKLWEHKDRFWSWISNGAIVYVCGDALRMAKDVDRTIQEIAQHFGEDGPAFVKQLEQDNRYQKDVY